MTSLCIVKLVLLSILVNTLCGWKHIDSTISYSFKSTTHSFSPNSLNVSVFHNSAIASASEVCKTLPAGADYRTCVFLCAHDIRLHRIALLQRKVLAEAYVEINPQHKDLLEKSNYVATRRRDHEMLAIMRHFDNLDVVDVDEDSNSRPICFIGNQIRLHILLTMLSFESVHNIKLLTFSSNNDGNNQDYYSEDDWGTVQELIHSILMSKVLEHFPQKSLRKIPLSLDDDDFLWYKLPSISSNCSIILLPSDYDTLFFGTSLMATFMEIFLNVYANLPAAQSPTFILISDFLNEGVYHHKDNHHLEKSLSCDNLARFHRKKFVWYTQDSWPRHSVLFPSHQDSLGFPSSFHYLAVLKKYDNFLTSSVYVGKLAVSAADISSRNNHGTTSKSVINKETLVIVISYQLLIYSETALGLKQQLQEELNYPHVLIIPLFTYEMMDFINDYLVDISLSEECGNDVTCSPLHVVQVILTPHVPSSRVVSSLDYPLMDAQSSMFLRRVIFSYVAVIFEQEWFFKLSMHTFIGGISLLNNARSVWTFSEVQRLAVQRMYLQQIELENAMIKQKYRNETTAKNMPDSYKDLMLHSQQRIQDPDFVDIVPIFAPCSEQMPCHQDFNPPLLSLTSNPSYDLIFYGMCSEKRRVFLKSLITRMKTEENLSMIRLNHLCDLNKDAESTPPQGIFGPFRDETLLSRSSIVLNINNHNDSVLEMHRIMYLLGMGKCILSQRGRDATLSSLAALQGAVYFVDTAEDVMRTLQYLFTPYPTIQGMNGELSFEHAADAEGLEAWISLAHGPYQRLAACEKHSLEAYHIMHHRDSPPQQTTSSASMSLQGDTRPESRNVYGTHLLEKAMDRLRRRLATVEREDKKQEL